MCEVVVSGTLLNNEIKIEGFIGHTATCSKVNNFSGRCLWCSLKSRISS